MNRKIGMCSAAVNLIAVVGFAVSMPLMFSFGNYFFSMFIAFSFVPMMCSFAYYSERDRKLAGYVSVGFASMYAAIILLVYFAQLTTVRFGGLTRQAASLLDFQQFGLFFYFDLLGYSVMALATFFAGLTVSVRSKADRWLKGLLLGHGVFFFSCLIMPMLGVFTAEGETWAGIAALEFWCVYFIPISVLSLRYFSKQGSSGGAHPEQTRA